MGSYDPNLGRAGDYGLYGFVGFVVHHPDHIAASTAFLGFANGGQAYFAGLEKDADDFAAFNNVWPLQITKFDRGGRIQAAPWSHANDLTFGPEDIASNAKRRY